MPGVVFAMGHGEAGGTHLQLKKTTVNMNGFHQVNGTYGLPN